MSIWSQNFQLKPIPYGATERRERRAEFKAAVQALIEADIFFVDDIKLEITIFLDQQETYETDKNADLDNYAKMIIDCLKGVNGIIVDDTQIQSLHISWIDTVQEPSFAIEAVTFLPDTTFSKNFKLYEMPDKLWYPIRHDLTVEKGDESYQFHMGLILASNDIGCRVQIRQTARRKKISKFEAYRISGMMTGYLRGFHKSRIIDSGFELVDHSTWKAELDQWKFNVISNDEKVLEGISMIEEMYTSRAKMLDSLPG